jgi:cation transport protein ChaC
MWVFAYGSLMWDGWESTNGCVRRTVALLPAYSRAFDKASVKRWSSKDVPCPTLSLVPLPGSSCLGIAFEFSPTRNARR